MSLCHDNHGHHKPVMVPIKDEHACHTPDRVATPPCHEPDRPTTPPCHAPGREPTPPPCHAPDRPTTPPCPAHEVVIIGAGLTGLCAGYELAKLGIRVVIVERTDFLGGNVRSVTLGNGASRGTVLDFGPERIWASNGCVRDVVNQLGLGTKLVSRKRHTLIHSNRGFAELFCRPPRVSHDDDSCSSSDEEEDEDEDVRCKNRKPASTKPTHSQPAYTELDTRSPLGDAFRSDLAKLVHDIGSRLSLFKPDTSLFCKEDVLLKGFLDRNPRVAELCQTMLRAQGYGTTSELPTALMLPLLIRMMLCDDMSFDGHATQLIQSLAHFIRSHGGEIASGARAISIDTEQRTVDVVSSDDGSMYSIPFVHCLVACPLGSVMVNKTDVFREAKPVRSEAVPMMRYTATAQVCVQLDAIPVVNGSATWTHLFEGCTIDPSTQVMEDDNLQIVAVSNLSSVCRLSNHVMLTLASRCDDVATLTRFCQRDEPIQRSKLQQLLSQMDAFKHAQSPVKLCDVVHCEVFKCTQPVLNLAMYQKVCDINDAAAEHHDNHVWFAGSYLGAGPCTETSCYSGRSMALRIAAAMDPQAHQKVADEFEARMIRVDKAAIIALRHHIDNGLRAQPRQGSPHASHASTAGLAVVATLGVTAVCEAARHVLVPKPCIKDAPSDEEEEDEDEPEICLSDDIVCRQRAHARRAAEIARRRAATLYATRSIKNSFDDC